VSATSGFLLDTNVVSELVKAKPEPRVIAFLSEVSDAWLSAVTLHELTYGAERSPDPTRRTKLLAWIGQIAAQFSGRVVSIDGEVAELSGRLRAMADAEGRPADPLDALIAANALLRGLTLATRNTRDFEVFGVPLFNPWREAR
jgi:predicted nucleic acid-binding protein